MPAAVCSSAACRVWPSSRPIGCGWAGATATLAIEGPYRFPPLLGDIDAWLLAEGTHQRPYEVLGAHPCDCLGKVVWAPNARRVSVVGNSQSRDGRRHPMRWRGEAGVELSPPQVAAADRYKFELLDAEGMLACKADPFALRAELRSATASVVAAFAAAPPASPAHGASNAVDAPISIYEVHLSWRRHDDGRWLGYRELAEKWRRTR